MFIDAEKYRISKTLLSGFDKGNRTIPAYKYIYTMLHNIDKGESTKRYVWIAAYYD